MERVKMKVFLLNKIVKKRWLGVGLTLVSINLCSPVIAQEMSPRLVNNVPRPSTNLTDQKKSRTETPPIAITPPMGRINNRLNNRIGNRLEVRIDQRKKH